MTTINEIFRTFGPEYLERYAMIMPKSHRKVIDSIIGCRTEVCGIALYQCEKCGELHRVYRSCGNRHCPTCQHHKTRQWLEKQMKRLLPGHHFLLTFTVPENLRRGYTSPAIGGKLRPKKPRAEASKQIPPTNGCPGPSVSVIYLDPDGLQGGPPLSFPLR